MIHVVRLDIFECWTQDLQNRRGHDSKSILTAHFCVCVEVESNTCSTLWTISQHVYFIYTLKHLIHFVQISLSVCNSPSACFLLFLSGRAHGSVVEALVDGSWRHSSWDSELCVSCLPPFRHHHLLQGYQKVRCTSCLSQKAFYSRCSDNFHCHRWITSNSQACRLVLQMFRKSFCCTFATMLRPRSH